MAKGWGPGTRERQHASRDTIPERWGERTHPRTQDQLSLNRSALAAVRLQLPTLASGVGNLPFDNGSLYVGELPTRAPDPPTLFSLFASGVDSLPYIEIPPRAPTLGPRVGKVKRAGSFSSSRCWRGYGVFSIFDLFSSHRRAIEGVAQKSPQRRRPKGGAWPSRYFPVAAPRRKLRNVRGANECGRGPQI